MNLFIAASRFSQNSLFNVSIIPPVFLILCKYKGFLRKSQRIISFFSKINPSFFTIKEGSTSHLGLLPSGEKRKPLLLLALNRYAIWMADHQRFFLKSTRPSLPLKKAPHLSPSLSLLRRERMCQPPYSVLKPLRYMVGGPSEVYASSGAAVFLCGNEPALLKSCLWKRRDTMKDARC